MKKYNEELFHLAKEINETAVEKGFWDKEYSKYQYINVFTYAIGKVINNIIFNFKNSLKLKEIVNLENCNDKQFVEIFEYHIKPSIENAITELFMRYLDYIYHFDSYYFKHISYESILEANKSYYKNFDIQECLTNITLSTIESIKEDDSIIKPLAYLSRIINELNIDIEYYIKLKIKYNEIILKYD